MILITNLLMIAADLPSGVLPLAATVTPTAPPDDATAKALFDTWYTGFCSPSGRAEADRVWSLLIWLEGLTGLSGAGLVLGIVAWFKRKLSSQAARNVTTVIAAVSQAAAIASGPTASPGEAAHYAVKSTGGTDESAQQAATTATALAPASANQGAPA